MVIISEDGDVVFRTTGVSARADFAVLTRYDVDSTRASFVVEICDDAPRPPRELTVYVEGTSVARRTAVIDFLRPTGFGEIDGEQVGDEWTVVATIGEPAIVEVNLDALVDEVERAALTLGVEFDGSSRSE